MKWVTAYELQEGDILSDERRVEGLLMEDNDIEAVVFDDGTEFVLEEQDMEFPLETRTKQVRELEVGDTTVYGTVQEVSKLRYPSEIHVITDDEPEGHVFQPNEGITVTYK